MEYKIKKNVPIPEFSRHRKPIYPFGEMEIGDCFEADLSVHKKLVSAASYYGARNQKKFSVIIINKKNSNPEKIGVWRVK